MANEGEGGNGKENEQQELTDEGQQQPWNKEMQLYC
jgi:hypothetical protein